MKRFLKDFLKQGLVAAWGGPVVVAVIFLILEANGVVETLTVREMSLGILSSSLMAFIAGGISAIYRQEKLPLPIAILLHAAVLYLDYLLVYLMNGWLKNDTTPIVVFTAVFFVGFALIWLLIWQIIKRQVGRVNEKMQAQ